MVSFEPIISHITVPTSVPRRFSLNIIMKTRTFRAYAEGGIENFLRTSFKFECVPIQNRTRSLLNHAFLKNWSFPYFYPLAIIKCMSPLFLVLILV